MVSRLSQAAGTFHPSAERGLQHGMGAAARSARARPKAAGGVSRGDRGNGRLQHLPSMSDASHIASLRAQLDGQRGPRYWRSLEQLADTAEFREFLHREFPAGASEWADELSRR